MTILNVAYPQRKDMARLLPHHEGAEVREAEYLVEREAREVRRSFDVLEYRAQGTCHRQGSCIKQCVCRRGLISPACCGV